MILAGHMNNADGILFVQWFFAKKATAKAPLPKHHGGDLSTMALGKRVFVTLSAQKMREFLAWYERYERGRSGVSKSEGEIVTRMQTMTLRPSW